MSAKSKYLADLELECPEELGDKGELGEKNTPRPLQAVNHLLDCFTVGQGELLGFKEASSSLGGGGGGKNEPLLKGWRSQSPREIISQGKH